MNLLFFVLFSLFTLFFEVIVIGGLFCKSPKKGKNEILPPGLQKNFWWLVASHHSEPPDKILVARFLEIWLLGCQWQDGWDGSNGGWEKRKEAGVASGSKCELAKVVGFLANVHTFKKVF